MSKKMHRCPHCGEKGYKFTATMLGNRQNPTKSALVVNIGMSCERCGKRCASATDYSQLKTNRKLVWIPAVFLLLDVFLIVSSLLRWVLPAVVVFLIGGVYLISVILFSSYLGYLIPLKQDSAKAIIETHPNCKVKLNDNKYIRKMWVYGLKFETETKNIKFKERFTDGLVPAQFYPSKNGDNEFEIRIIGREFVPDEVLFEGAEFLVEDIDGIFICKGKITKLDLEF